ncbi:MAG: hypothetical protein M3Z50_05085 [Actinomycetota bacterium]|nr:hypothetical protein [Actinomycetota bacterium]
MSDQGTDAERDCEHRSGAEPAETSTVRAASTGHPAVDEVMRSLEQLDDAPVGEHAGIFERAHETLQQALHEPDLVHPSEATGESSGTAHSEQG